MFVRIIATPPGEAPEEVRRAWIGLELPLAAGETGPRAVPGGGVLSGPQAFLGKLIALLGGRWRLVYGYVIDAPQALMLLAEQAPWAARWWREHAPHCWEPGQLFLFPADVCAVGPTHRPDCAPPAPPASPSEEFFPAPPEDATRKPPLADSSERVVEHPAPRAGRGIQSGGAARLRRPPPFALLECVGWIASATSVFFVPADLIGGRYSLIAVRALFFAVGLGLAWWSRQARHKDYGEIEPLRRQPEPAREPLPARVGHAFDIPAGQAKVVFLPEPKAPTLTVETRGRTCPVEPTPPLRGLFLGRPRLVQPSLDRLEIVPDALAWAGGLVLTVATPVVIWLAAALGQMRGGDLFDPVLPYVVLPAAHLAAIVSIAAGLRLIDRRVCIDRAAGEVRYYQLFRERVICRLGEVLAVQVVGPRPSCQVNLVLDDPDKARINLVSHGHHETKELSILWCARRLALFLGTPLVDQLESQAVLSPTEMTDRLASVWLAGHHNAELTELAPGILELRPVVRGDAFLADVLAGAAFHQVCATVTFDRNRGHRPRLFVSVLPGAGFGRLPEAVRKPRPLQDIAAIELAPGAEGRPDVPVAPSRPICRLNLLLRDATCPVLELAPHADEAWARRTGRRLARFLGVPLEDRVRVEAS